jgi:circadian clock protein KaiC
VVVVDPISNMTTAGANGDAHLMLVRLIDFFKSNHITSLFTSLTQGGEDLERTAEEVSSLTDTWLLLRGVETNGERNRVLYILKSRGMAHSNQLREFLLTDHGIELLDVYTGPEGVLTGTARATQEARERAATAEREAEVMRRQRELERKRQVTEAHVAALRAEVEAAEADMQQFLQQEEQRGIQLSTERTERARLRRADTQTSARARPLTAVPHPPRRAASR